MQICLITIILVPKLCLQSLVDCFWICFIIFLGVHTQLGKNPVSIVEAPKPEEKWPDPVFEGIEEFKGTEEEFNEIREYGSSWRKRADGTTYEYGIYHEEEHPEDADAEAEWDD